MTFAKSESEKLIKPKIMISKIIAPKTYDPKDYETSSVSEIVSPADAINPEKDSVSADIHDDKMINDMTDLVIEEDSPTVKDVRAIESDDDDAFDWLIVCLCVKIKFTMFV